MLCLERFRMTLEWKHANKAETTNTRTQKSQKRVAFGWLSARSREKTSCPKSFQGSRNQLILRFDVILQHNWPIEQCLLHVRFSLEERRRVHVLIFSSRRQWLIKQITNTYRHHFSRSYENRSLCCVVFLFIIFCNSHS